MTATLILSPDDYGIVVREAEEAFPRECCGLLIGYGENRATVTQVVIAQNHADSSHRFLIDPQVQFDWMRKLRGTDHRIIGHYHSHPNGRAEASVYDAEMASEPGQFWLIIPVNEGAVGGMKAFQVRPEGYGFNPAALQFGVL